MPPLGPDDDVRETFARFWSEERVRALRAAVERLVRGIVFTGKPPLADAVVDAMNARPGILKRRAAVERVIAGIDGIIATFDEGIGELDA